MSDGYLANGKTILCRASEADRYKSLADIEAHLAFSVSDQLLTMQFTTPQRVMFGSMV
jgi:hypothetical protein